MRQLLRSVVSTQEGNGGGERAGGRGGDSNGASCVGGASAFLPASQFHHEPMRVFFANVKGLVNSSFHALYDEVQAAGARHSRNWTRGAMKKGLNFMTDTANANVIIDTVVESEQACRSLTQLYFNAMHVFLRANATKNRDILRANFAPFSTFITKLYQTVAALPEMRDAYFTTMSYAEKETMLADVMRQVMYMCVVWPDKATQPRTSRMTVTSPSPSPSSVVLPADSVSNAPPPPSSSSYVAAGSQTAAPPRRHHRGASSFSGAPRQDDAPPSIVMGQSVAKSVLSAANLNHEDASVVQQQTSGDTQPPVVFNKPHPRNRDHDKVIQVDITGAQQHHALPQGPRGPSSSGDASIHDDGDDVSDA